jgi:hypothetical protein
MFHENILRSFEMKKILFVTLLMAVMVLSCDNGNGKNDPVLCTCNPKEHYLPCTCGGTDCTCDVIPRGYVTDATRPTINFPIYQSVGVTDTQAETTKNNIITAWNSDEGIQNALKGKITKIVIVAGSGYSADKASGVCEIGADYGTGDILDIFRYVVLPAFNDET